MYFLFESFTLLVFIYSMYYLLQYFFSISLSFPSIILLSKNPVSCVTSYKCVNLWVKLTLHYFTQWKVPFWNDFALLIIAFKVWRLWTDVIVMCTSLYKFNFFLFLDVSSWIWCFVNSYVHLCLLCLQLIFHGFQVSVWRKFVCLHSWIWSHSKLVLAKENENLTNVNHF